MRKGLKSRVHFLFQDAPFHVGCSVVLCCIWLAACSSSVTNQSHSAAAHQQPLTNPQLSHTPMHTNTQHTTTTQPHTQAASTLTEEQVARFGGSSEGLTWFQW